MIMYDSSVNSLMEMACLGLVLMASLLHQNQSKSFQLVPWTKRLEDQKVSILSREHPCCCFAVVLSSQCSSGSYHAKLPVKQVYTAHWHSTTMPHLQHTKHMESGNEFWRKKTKIAGNLHIDFSALRLWSWDLCTPSHQSPLLCACSPPVC